MLVFDFIDKNIKVRIHEDEAKDFINELKRIFKQPELNTNIISMIGGFERLKVEVLRRWEWIIKKESERIVDSTERRLYVESETNYLKRRLEFLHKKYELWKEECLSLTSVLKKIKQYVSAKENAIRLSTIHRAKGLEENRIFIIDYDKLPFFRLDQKDWEKIQEINLKYVAITRAKQELFLVDSVKLDDLKAEGSLFDIMPF